MLDFLQLVAQLDNGEPNHPGIETKSSADSRLHGTGGIEAHDEVVAFPVAGLMLRRGPGQTEGTPVGESADYAAGAEDLDAGIAGDTVVCQ